MNIQLETITPLHIGSGVQMMGNAEYVYFSDTKELVLVDEAKVLDLIGVDQIQIWVNLVEQGKEDFLQYLKQRKPNLRPSDIAKRILPLRGNIRPERQNSLREQLHNGMGIPYLPGSSLKGAIRTAVFGSEVLRFGRVAESDLFNGNRCNHNSLNSRIFGPNPNVDWFRMLQVGDTYFKVGTRATFANTLNRQGRNADYEYKNEVKQLIEFIPSGSVAEVPIQVTSKHLEQILRLHPNYFKPTARNFNLPSLFEVIHKHTLRSLKREIDYFKEKDILDAEEWVENLNDINNRAKSFTSKECLIRVGFGTGYLSMTGDWLDEMVQGELYDRVGNAARRNAKYSDFDMPKSRKMLFQGTPLGYIKLTMP
jgi:CRISPR type III-A-associated RAMP protein Csm5